MKKVIQYQASDNSLHNSEIACKQHEAKIAAVAALQKILQPTLSTMRPEAVLKHIVEEQAAIREILLSYNKKTPRKPVEHKLPDHAKAA